MGRALAAAPDPALARVALSRVGERQEAREALEQAIEPAARLLGFSGAAADFLFAHPEEAVLFTDLGVRSRESLLEEVEADVARLGSRPGLRRFRRRAVFRLAARDLEGAPLEEVLSEMSAIAEVCLEMAKRTVGPPLAIIGMGKLGGAELNYASDVDVIFVHLERDSDEAARHAAGVVALLAEPTEDGVALRVDTTLRPEGRAGPLSRTVASTLEYYRRHAATWERQALLKARLHNVSAILDRVALTLDRNPELLGSIGRAVPGVEVNVVDEKGLEVPIGEAGEIITRGPHVMKGYFCKPEATAARIRDGWLFTGDIGKRGEDGYYFHLGRRDDMIVTGGLNVYPAEVETMIYGYAQVQETVVFAIPDAKRGYVIGAAVVARPGETVVEKDLLTFLRTNLATFKVPHKIIIRESLPRTSSGKVIRDAETLLA